MKIFYIIVICILFLLSGCTIIPGSHLNNNYLSNQLDEVEIISIDLDLINSLHNHKNDHLVEYSEAMEKDPYTYRIGIGDVLSIGVWDHPELTIPAVVQRTAEFDGFRVQSDGTITFAYAAKTPAAGKTIIELHDDLILRLSKVIEDPQLDLKVVAFNSQKVYITGEVNMPGILPITEVPLTLIDAVNQSNGLTDRADWQEITFTRENTSENINLRLFYAEGDASQNRLLEHGDVIHVNRLDKQRVYVLGEVSRAGSVEINRYGLSLAEALSEAGGIKEDSADASGIFVLRKNNINNSIKTTVYQLNAKDATSLILASEFELKAQDIVYVTTASIARWSRVISKLVPLTRSAEDISRVNER